MGLRCGFHDGNQESNSGMTPAFFRESLNSDDEDFGIKKVKIPALSHKTRQGWGTQFLMPQCNQDGESGI